MNTDNTNNRGLTSRELYDLLKKLGVIQKIKESKALAFLEYIMEMDGKLGNPADSQSMLELKKTLLQLKVNINEEKNIRIISEAIYNTKISNAQHTNLYNPEDVFDDNLEICLELLMLELGFNPSLEGFCLFRDCVLYLINSDEKLLWQKEVYPMLGKKYNTNGDKVERNIRNCIINGYKNHPDNEICQSIYSKKDSVANTECFCSVAEYIKYNEQKIKDEVVSYARNSNIANMSLDQIVGQTIRFLGIFPNLKGYNYMKEAILYVLEDNGPIRGNSLYERVAQAYNTAEANVSRTITTAILKSNKYYIELKNKKDEQLVQIPEVVKFVYKYISKFENFEFIALTALYIKITAKDRLIEINESSQNNKPIARIKTKPEI